MGYSLFTRLSQVVVARDIQTPLLPPLRPDMTVADALGRIYAEDVTQTDDVVLVQKDNVLVGWVEMVVLQAAWGDVTDEDWPEQWPRILAPISFAGRVGPDGEPPPAFGRDAPVESVMSPIQYMSADTPLFEAARALADSVPRAVLHGTHVTGTIDYKDLCKMPFRVLLFALVLELEELAHHLVMQGPLKSWDALSPEARERALGRMHRADHNGEKLKSVQIRSTYAFAFARDLGNLNGAGHSFLRDAATGRKVRVRDGLTAAELLVCSAMNYLIFDDKLHILAKRRLIGDLPPREVQRISRDAKDLRNQCAHPQTQDFGTFDAVESADWWRTIEEIHGLMASIERAGKLDDEV